MITTRTDHHVPDDLRADELTDPRADQFAATVRCPVCPGPVRMINRPGIAVMTAEVEHTAACPDWVYRFPEAAMAMGPQDDTDTALSRVVTTTAAGDLIVRLRHHDGTPVHL